MTDNNPIIILLTVASCQITAMRSNVGLYLKTFFGIACLLVYCEYVIYYVVIHNCEWPELDPKNEDPNIEQMNFEPVKIMVLADTHLLGSRHGHWFDKLRREWQMHRAFQTALSLLKPELVFILGDLTDEGFFCSNEEFDYYVKRFYSIFAVPATTKLYVAVGNHDIGFHYRITPYLNQRFVSGFNTPAVQLISVRGNHFVLINSMALEGDGCFVCKPAEHQLNRIQKTLQCSKGTYNGKCSNIPKLNIYSNPILMQHFPLYRPSDMDCDDFDSAPNPIKQERFKEKWECLSKDATTQILNQIKPRLALSGHTHHGCTRPLPTGEGIEITIPSFSWRNKDNPNFGIGIFTPNNYAFVKCEMPKESTVIMLYIVGVSVLLLWLTFSISSRRRRYKIKLR